MTLERLDGSPRYAHAIRHGDTVYLAGQVPEDLGGNVANQARQVLDRIDRLLSKFGTDKRRLLAATVYLREISALVEFNRVWEAWIDPAAKPTRTVVEARMGHPDYRVEISVVAAA
ncbi:RidA family protein [Mesorhizobium sp. IMUNJ 23232]|uniref:RidA family protein n=1 Tax=Mesorhizobium sp. IMUNJ 23232 TaxID=3376064 RepID=UPI00379D94A3